MLYELYRYFCGVLFKAPPPTKDDHDQPCQPSSTTPTVKAAQHSIQTNLTKMSTHDANDEEGNGSTSNEISQPQAIMPVDLYLTEYDMTHKYRGLALIFNHVHFDDPTWEPRHSSDVDAESLTQALSNLHFNVCVFKDYNFKQIMTILELIAKTIDHSDCDCILVAILSHGENGHLYAKDKLYKQEQILSHFFAENCPSLAGKPKIFFIQACQGKLLDGGFLMGNRAQTDNADSMMEICSRTQTDGATIKPASPFYKIPNQADLLIAQSTLPGFVSWRDEYSGSWFIQSLCKELNENGKHYDILRLLTTVNRKVAFEYESHTDDPDRNEKKQVPCITYMLTKTLTFNEK